jgi:sugar phosphate isomerase/epimerase
VNDAVRTPENCASRSRAPEPRLTARPLSLAHLSLLNLSPPELLTVAARADFDAVGLRISPASSQDTPFPVVADASLLRQTQRQMRATGVTVLDVEVVRLDAVTSIAALAPVIDTAERLGARFMVVSSGDSDHNRLADKFALLCEEAVPAGLRPVLEFMPYSSVRTLADASQIVAGSRGGLLVDALHLQRSGGAPGDLANVDPELLPYVQLCDARQRSPGGIDHLLRESRHDRLPPGGGELALRALLGALPRHDLPISIEAPSDRLRSRYGDVAFARLLRRGVRTLLADLPKTYGCR